jgi:DNA-binding response OmpR family regulator
MQSVDELSVHGAATIVLAEDDSDLRAIYAHCLREAGHVVWEAVDGGQALALVRAHVPELLLLDIWMPILNGLEVLERLAGTPEGVGLKIVVLSRQDDADTRLEGFALGVVDYWTKDMPVAELRDRIERMTRPTSEPAGRSGYVPS